MIGVLIAQCIGQLFPELAKEAMALTNHQSPSPSAQCQGRPAKYATQYVKAMSANHPLDAVPVDLIADVYLARQSNQTEQERERQAGRARGASAAIHHFNIRLEAQVAVDWKALQFLFPAALTLRSKFLCFGFDTRSNTRGDRVACLSTVSPVPLDDAVKQRMKSWATYYALTQGLEECDVVRHISHEGAFYSFADQILRSS